MQLQSDASEGGPLDAMELLGELGEGPALRGREDRGLGDFDVLLAAAAVQTAMHGGGDAAAALTSWEEEGRSFGIGHPSQVEVSSLGGDVMSPSQAPSGDGNEKVGYKEVPLSPLVGDTYDGSDPIPLDATVEEREFMERVQSWVKDGPPDAADRQYRRPDDQARAGAPARALRRAAEGDEVGDWMSR